MWHSKVRERRFGRVCQEDEVVVGGCIVVAVVVEDVNVDGDGG